jgi:hypothetical protein
MSTTLTKLTFFVLDSVPLEETHCCNERGERLFLEAVSKFDGGSRMQSQANTAPPNPTPKPTFSSAYNTDSSAGTNSFTLHTEPDVAKNIFLE